MNQPSSPAGQSKGEAFRQMVVKERIFLAIVASALILVGLTYPYAGIARWVGFAIAGYSAVANDSVQTLGTFIGSNRDRPWWTLWLWIGGIFLVTVGYSWWAYAGDVTYERLASKGFEETPMAFTFLQVAAPIVLLFLTRCGIPVSTTLLLLSCFATTPASIGKVLTKSLLGYAIAFSVGILVWFAVSQAVERWQAKGPAAPRWRIAQWCTTGLLWSIWLMQDAANVAIYLPRSLSVLELAVFAGVIFLGLGVLFRQGGERVQKIIDEKARVVDVRAATLVDLVYAVILFVFKMESKIPMSTTWVFVGLLAGREIAMTLRGVSGTTMTKTLRLAGKDLAYVTIGLLVSLAMAYVANASLSTP
jgi:phosphate/sulfate permease